MPHLKKVENLRTCYIDRLIGLCSVECYKELLLSEMFTLSPSQINHILEIVTLDLDEMDKEERAKVLVYYYCGPHINILDKNDKEIDIKTYMDMLEDPFPFPE